MSTNPSPSWPYPTVLAWADSIIARIRGGEDIPLDELADFIIAAKGEVGILIPSPSKAPKQTSVDFF